jgi:hypothetical protein
MRRLIKCSLSAYSRYKVHPVVLIFAIKGFSGTAIEKEFAIASKKFFFKTDSKFWAKECLLLSSKSILDFINQSPMDPIVAIWYFLTSGAVSLASLKYQSDPTVQLLYHISKKIVMNERDKKDKFVNPILEGVKKQLKKLKKIVGDKKNTSQENEGLHKREFGTTPCPWMNNTAETVVLRLTAALPIAQPLDSIRLNNDNCLLN